MTFTPARTNSAEPNRAVADPLMSDSVFDAAVQAYRTAQEAQVKKLNDDLRRQVKEEVGDMDEASPKTLLMVRQKFGISAPIISRAEIALIIGGKL